MSIYRGRPDATISDELAAAHGFVRKFTSDKPLVKLDDRPCIDLTPIELKVSVANSQPKYILDDSISMKRLGYPILDREIVDVLNQPMVNPSTYA